MLEPILSGITFGLILAIMLGPVFFALLQTSLHEGFKAGAYLAFGVFLSDTALIGACYFFAAQLNLLEENHILMAFLGGSLLIIFGIVNFFKKIKLKEIDDNKKTVHAKFVLQGFFLNIFNPAVLLFWLGVVGIVTIKDHYTKLHTIVFFSSLLLTVLATDLLKSFVSHKIKKILQENVIIWLNRTVGLALMAFGLHMIIKAL
ncbi:MAG TPA: LysE family transporter [Bacteroidia bacterium]|nr:LysE family transporter [Bacteroidia bacterium]HNS13024.1 LysE family transporter [Bacteroidia bacterium]